MLVAGDYSPHLNDTVAMNARLDPSNSTWMKVIVVSLYSVDFFLSYNYGSEFSAVRMAFLIFYSIL